MFSAVQVINDKWTLLGEVGWQDWTHSATPKVNGQSTDLDFRIPGMAPSAPSIS